MKRRRINKKEYIIIEKKEKENENEKEKFYEKYKKIDLESHVPPMPKEAENWYI